MFLALAIVLGGGGTPNPASELALELLAVLTALAWVWLPRAGQPPLPRDPLAWAVMGLVVLVPLAQLIPLPPRVWTALPGRETQVSALALVGAADSWRPLSTSPSHTLASLLSLGPPLLMLAMAATLDSRQRRWLIATVALMTLVSALFGALQLAGGNDAVRLYNASNQLVVTGFQANRNAEADVLLVGVLALAALSVALPGAWNMRGRRTRSRWLAAVAALLLLATVLTASRMGIALIAVALLGAGAILAQDPDRRWGGSLGRVAGAGLALLAAGLVLLQSNARLQAVAARFGLQHEGRAELWSDSGYVVAQYWPFGSGMGTFMANFIAAEPLEVVDATVPNRAHNDFLELTIEAGAFGIAALAVVIALLLAMAFLAWRRRPQDRAQVLFGVAVLLVIGLHSLVDYPLRSMALACLAALGAAMFARPPAPAAERHPA
ncbi:MAG: O-antigen ligase family protein [Novosphingobium sp.]|nr:O-antigen ligase family protein [Novosphingobium sp.]